MRNFLRYCFNDRTNRWYLQVDNALSAQKNGVCSCNNCQASLRESRGTNLQSVLDYMEDTKGLWEQ